MTGPAGPVVRRAVRVTVAALTGFYVCLYGLGDSVSATYALFTAIALGALSEVSGTPRQRLTTYLAATAAGAFLVCLGTLLAVGTWAAAAGMLVVGFVVAYAGVGGPRLVGVANGLQLLYVLPCFPPFQPDTLDQRLAGLALGAALLILTDRYLLPPAVSEPFADRVARLSERVAGFVATLGDVLHAPDPARVAELDRGRAVLEEAPRLRLTRTARHDRPLGPGVRDRSLLATSAAVRAAADRAAALADLIAGPATHPRTADLVDETGRVLAGIARTLRSRDRAAPVDVTALEAALDAHAAARRPGPAIQLRAGLAAVALADDVRLAALAVGGFIGAPPPEPGRTPSILWFLHARPAQLWWVRVRGHLTPRSVYLQNAVRLAVGLATARVVAGVFDLAHGFWVLLATLSLMRTSALADRPVLLRAFTGTLAGAVVAAGVLLLVGDDVEVYAWLLPVIMVVTFATGPLLGVAAAQGGFTVLVAVLFAQLAPATWQLAEVRVVDVVVGGLIGAVIGVAVWPRGGGGEIRRVTADALRDVADDVEDVAAHLTGVRRSVGDPASALHRAALMLGHAYEQYRTEPMPKGPAPDWLTVVLVVHRQDTYGGIMRDLHPAPPADTGPDGETLLACARTVADAYRRAADAVAEGRPPVAGGAEECRAGFPAVPAAPAAAGDTRELDGWGWLHGLCDDLSGVERALAETDEPGRPGGGANRLARITGRA